MELKRAVFSVLFVPLALGFVASGAALAGPCTVEILKTQERADAKLHRKAAEGPSASQSDFATSHQQPTPATIAQAEKALGEGQAIRAALDALDRARAADLKGDASVCQAELQVAENALKPQP